MNGKIVKQWTTVVGLRALIILINNSHHCGYVEVPDTLTHLDEPDFSSSIDVHGGVTYFDALSHFGLGKNLFVGFDCAHFGDKARGSEYGVWRDVSFCEAECENMAGDIVRMQQLEDKSSPTYSAADMKLGDTIRIADIDDIYIVVDFNDDYTDSVKIMSLVDGHQTEIFGCTKVEKVNVKFEII